MVWNVLIQGGRPMKRLALALAFIVLLSLPSCRLGNHRSAPQDVQNDTIYPLGFCTDSFALVEGNLGNGQLLTGLLVSLGMEGTDAHNLATMVSDSVFNTRRMRPGDQWWAYYDTTSSPERLQYFVYANNKVDLTVFQCADSLAAWRYSRPIVKNRRFSDITITSSLWNDMKAAGASTMLIMDLSDIYAWTVDFFSLQDGDRFRVIYTENICEGELISIDSIYYARFDRGETVLPAILFDNHDGGNLYWNEKGESLRKAFLKAPLQFSRISSGFSYHRKHPVHGDIRAHTAVDYAAPTGTPVMSIGDGTVISKGWAGGGGNTVKIRHNSVYTTSYMHLSKYAAGLKVGDHVRQGQVIGYVGMTGTATGPHLDFRVWKNGTPVNPLTMDSPPSDPVPVEKLPVLDSLYRRYSAEMDSLSVSPAVPEN